MSTIAFLALGVVLAVVLNLVFGPIMGLLWLVAVKMGATWPNFGTQRLSTCLVMLVATATGFWLAWLIVM